MNVRNLNQWNTFLNDAAKLTDLELAQHASVSTTHAHFCRDCFTCACIAEQARRAYDKPVKPLREAADKAWADLGYPDVKDWPDSLKAAYDTLGEAKRVAKSAYDAVMANLGGYSLGYMP
jgi:hypothetical protein